MCRACFLYVMMAYLTAMPSGYAQDQLRGTVRGRVTDNLTERPLVGVSVRIIQTMQGATSDPEGHYSIRNVPVGTYTMRFSGIGYAPNTVADVVVTTGHRTIVNMQMVERPYETEGLTVEADYFNNHPENVGSSHTLRYEEIRRSAGGAEDVSRVVQSFPGVSMSTDARNDLIVRGGSPTENLTLLDNIEIANANHFGTQGATGGPVGMIHVDFIDGVSFLTGGFNARYGDKLSSVLDIRLREGNPDAFQGDINLSTAGFGGVFEGPLGSDANWLFAARKSYLDLLVDPLGLGAIPHYGDVQFKTVWRPDVNHFVSLLGIGGVDEIVLSSSDRNEQEPRAMYTNTRNFQNQYTVGARWRMLWNKSGYSEIAASVSGSNFLIDVRDTLGNFIFRNASEEVDATIKAEAYFQIYPRLDVEGGISFKPAQYHHNIYARADTTPLGYVYPLLSYDSYETTSKLALYLQGSFDATEQLSFIIGLRADYFALTGQFDISPRFRSVFELDRITRLFAAYGKYSQTPTYLWVSSDPVNRALGNIHADHFLVGVERNLAPDVLASLEVYAKEYDDYPVSLLVPTFIFINGGTDYGLFLGGPARNAGHGYVRGIDFSLQKKMSGNYYGLISYSFSRSEFRALEGGWKPGNFDYRHVFTLTGGMRISDSWEIAVKWRYAGGRPYTPFDETASIAAGRGIADFHQVNANRYPSYHRLDLRADYRAHFNDWNAILYVELQNVYNRTNIHTLFWDEVRNELGQVNQWAFFPIFGFSIEF